jgi:hypothetical protein
VFSHKRLCVLSIVTVCSLTVHWTTCSLSFSEVILFCKVFNYPIRHGVLEVKMSVCSLSPKQKSQNRTSYCSLSLPEVFNYPLRDETWSLDVSVFSHCQCRFFWTQRNSLGLAKTVFRCRMRTIFKYSGRTFDLEFLRLVIILHQSNPVTSNAGNGRPLLGFSSPMWSEIVEKTTQSPPSRRSISRQMST